MQPQQNPSPVLTLPMAVVLAAAIIGGALLYIFRPTGSASSGANAQASAAANLPDTSALPPVTAADHILGDPNAPIKIVEYADPSCPYCKLFQPTMLEVMQDYGASGQVAWVYRQFPLDQPDANGNVLHPNAGTQANAFECAASVGGNSGFWAYEKDWFSTFPQDGADETSSVDDQQILQTAKDVDLDTPAFESCVASDEFASKVSDEAAGGSAVGIDGTPTSYLVTPTGSPVQIEGAQSYATMKTAIDAILQDMSANGTSTAAAQ